METTNKTNNAIKRSASWYRPYVVNGKTIKQVNVYFEGEVLYTVNCGWLENGSSDVVEICGIHEVLKRNKVKLDGKHFIIKADNEMQKFEKETVYSLYICARVEKVGEYLKWENEEQRTYQTKYKMFQSGLVSKLDKKDESGNWTYKDVVIPFIELEGNMRIERTDFGLKVDALYNDMKSEEIEINKYELERICSKYEVIKK